MDAAEITRRIAELTAQVRSHARDPLHPPRILPVTKTQPVPLILALREAGITEIGENRAQEIVEKSPQLGSDFSIHLIGRLQTNKIKYIMGRVCMVQSLDRLALAEALDARARAEGRVMPVLLQVNIGGEAQKAGVAERDAEAFCRKVAAMPGLSVRGLMAVMPQADDGEQLRPLFARMRRLFEQLRVLDIPAVRMEELSMGMSGDWRVAAEEGATCLRIGSAIFGPRS